MADESDNDEDAGGGGINIETVRSYLAFARRALRQRLALLASVFSIGLLLTFAVYRWFPRTFVCKTVILGQGEQVLEGNGNSRPFAGAADLILRHDNLEAIIRETGLIKKVEQRRPALPALKAHVLGKFSGGAKPDEEDVIAGLVGTLETKIQVEVDGSTLAITVDWTDGKTAAELAEAARESYLKTRHTSELSAFQEKMAILDGHATRLRQEVEALAQQIRSMHEENVSKAKASAAAAIASAPPSAPPPSRRVVRVTETSDPELPELREKLAAQKRKLADLSGERERRMREQQAKIDELKLKLAPSHPEVLTAEQKLALIEQEPSEVALLRAEIHNLQGDIEQREASGGHRETVLGAGRGANPAGPAHEPELLPTEIVRLLDAPDTDPVLGAQLSGAIRKYSSLRDDLRSSRIDLDTAQAAFNHRYRLIVPADVPTKPTKPKGAVLLGGGMFASLLLALLLPILAELRRGVIIERWQVQSLALPVLGELRLPPRPKE
jgi:uncharacterized protein involved in exopolysaccharide biosynthesis